MEDAILEAIYERRQFTLVGTLDARVEKLGYRFNEAAKELSKGVRLLIKGLKL